MVASALLALVIGAVLVGLLLAIATLRDATEAEGRSKDVSIAAVNLEKTVLDIETAVRGYVVNGDSFFLIPYRRSRAELPQRITTFQELTQHNPAQRARVKALVSRIHTYLSVYTEPIIDIFKDDPRSARSSIAQREGRRYVEGIREHFRQISAAEDEISARSALGPRKRSQSAATRRGRRRMA